MMRREGRAFPPSDDQFLTGALSDRLSARPAPTFNETTVRRRPCATTCGDCRKEEEMRSSSLSFGLPARLALFALVIAASIALGGFPGIGNHGSVATAAGGVTRTYYVAADEVAWDFAPSGMNKITGQPFGDTENVFMQNGSDRIGRVYRKALYREYTDATFTKLKARGSNDEHLGLLGPVIRAEVGDTIKFVFKNNTRFPVSVHPHGVFYDKASEGAPYADGAGAANSGDDAVAPGNTYTYTWNVPERAGPGPMDGSSTLWMYHSHVDEPGDTNAGLIGPIVITKKGMAKPDGSPADVDRELFTMFTVFDENSSPYLDANIQQFAGSPSTVKPDDDGFHESNLMHSINGYVYGNL